jgi:hypothetical protein
MDKINKLKNFFASKSYKWVLWVVAEIFLLALVFALGIRVGLHKAKYSFEWGANYEKNFMGHHGGPMGPGMMPPMGPDGPMGFFDDRGRDFRNGHGLAGNIVSITDNKIVVKDRENKENTVSVNDKTMIKSGRDDIKITDLKNDEKVVVVGKPDSNGTINAEIIRVFDSSNSPTPNSPDNQNATPAPNSENATSDQIPQTNSTNQ